MPNRNKFGTKLAYLDAMLDVEIDCPEWTWLQEHSSYEHRNNDIDNCGLYEFIYNVAMWEFLTDEQKQATPKKVRETIEFAIEENIQLVLFNIG